MKKAAAQKIQEEKKLKKEQERELKRKQNENKSKKRELEIPKNDNSKEKKLRTDFTVSNFKVNVKSMVSSSRDGWAVSPQEAAAPQEAAHQAANWMDQELSESPDGLVHPLTDTEAEISVPVEQPVDDVLTSYIRRGGKRQVEKRKSPRPKRSERKRYKESTDDDTLSDTGSTPSLDESTSDEMTLQEIKQRMQKKKAQKNSRKR